MFRIIWAIVRALVSAFRSRRDLLLENMVLRQQLAAFKARGKSPRIRIADRAFWVLLRRLWARWADALVFVKPDTVVRWLRAGQSWLTFLYNHRDVIAAMDFFVVFTVSFRLLYVLFVIRHGRRQSAHFSVTEHPTAAWVVQQLREAFP